MTIEQLLNCDADALEKMTDAELTAHFSPYFNITRPELAPKPRSQAAPQIDFAMQQKVKQLAALGIDVSGVLSAKKKR